MIVFVVGTDTNIGKTYATGLLAWGALHSRLKVITQKPVQTGSEIPEDLFLHRALMGLPQDPPDLLRLTNPYLFPYPAAPLTAAELKGETISLLYLKECLQTLEERYDLVFVEGAGGLLVPFTAEETFLDFISLITAPVVVVSPARLGTINHTLLTIEALRRRSLWVFGLVYNTYYLQDEFLAEKSLEEIKRFTGLDNILTMPPLKDTPPRDLLPEVQRFLRPILPL